MCSGYGAGGQALEELVGRGGFEPQTSTRHRLAYLESLHGISPDVASWDVLVVGARQTALVG